MENRSRRKWQKARTAAIAFFFISSFFILIVRFYINSSFFSPSALILRVNSRFLSYAYSSICVLFYFYFSYFLFNEIVAVVSKQSITSFYWYTDNKIRWLVVKISTDLCTFFIWSIFFAKILFCIRFAFSLWTKRTIKGLSQCRKYDSIFILCYQVFCWNVCSQNYFDSSF